MTENKTFDRARIGKTASLVGIGANIILSVLKIAVGLLFGAVSVMADGFNNLADSSNSVMSMISFKVSSKPADKEHPFGHQRAEYIFSMVVAFFIMLIAFELSKESVMKIIEPVAVEFSFITVGVLIFSILVKCGLWIYNKTVAEKINSDILKATAVDSLSDCISTTVVLVAIVVEKLTSVNIDGFAGLLVAVFIAWSGIGVFRETFSKLIGQATDAEMVEDIKKRIFAHNEVLGIHDLSVYNYGPEKYFASVHIEVDASVDVLVSHELVDDIEREFITETGIVLVGHLDPIVVSDPEVNEMREQVGEIIAQINSEFSMHDFRMVKGERRTNLIFDVAIPYGCALSEAQIKSAIEAEVAKIDEKYALVITVEHQTV